jgi:phosphatidylglycerol:prolipoprotein diacylglycerol transferase
MLYLLQKQLFLLGKTILNSHVQGVLLPTRSQEKILKPEAMETQMIIGTDHGGTIFSLTYTAAFLVAAGMMIHAGFRKNYPRSPWLLIILTGVIFFIIGDKVFTYSPDQWYEVFTRFQMPAADKKTVLGGIAGLLAGIFIARACLGFNRPVLDTLAIALPVSMAISRIGCLFAGCCFGIPTHLPWGIHYDAASWVYHAQLTSGLVHVHDGTSLAVHPVQVYQVIGCLLIALAAWKTRKMWKSPGSIFAFSVLCYATLRFFVEFVRAPETNYFTGHFFLGMKIIQWIILGAIIPGVLFLWYRETRGASSEASIRPFRISGLRQVLLTAVLSLIIFLGRNWFDRLEFVTILVFLILYLVVGAIKIYRFYSVAGFRWVVPLVSVCCISFMAQKSSSKAANNDYITFTSAGLTGVGGTYYEMFEKISKTWVPGTPGSGGCGDHGTAGYWSAHTQNAGTYQNTFYQGGLDISFNKWVGEYYKFVIGGRAFYGDESGGPATAYPATSSFGISPYMKMDWRWIGFGCGFTVGRMKLPLGHKDIYSYQNGDIISSEYKNFAFMPSFAFRAGPVDILYAEVQYPAVFPSATANPMARTGLGSGLGKTNGTRVSAGYCYPGVYAQAVLPIKNMVVLEGLYADNLLSGVKSERVFTLGISYRFSYRKTTRDGFKKQGGSVSDDSFSKLHATVADVEGNKYRTLAIGDRVWMERDLATTRFGDGSVIEGLSYDEEGRGILYNWAAVNDSRNLCPEGWHVPSLTEWRYLFNSLGGATGAPDKLGEPFSNEGQPHHWWLSTAIDSLEAQSFYLNTQTQVVMFANAEKSKVLSVRCVKNEQ